jgi:hypothetical protein
VSRDRTVRVWDVDTATCHARAGALDKPITLGAGVSLAFGREVHLGVEAFGMVRITAAVGSFADIPLPYGVALVQRARWEGSGRFGLATTARAGGFIAFGSAYGGPDLELGLSWREGVGAGFLLGGTFDVGPEGASGESEVIGPVGASLHACGIFDRSDTGGWAGVDAAWWITRSLYLRKRSF